MMLDRFLRGILPRAQADPIPVTVLIPGTLDHSLVRRTLDGVPRTVWTFEFGEAIENVNWHIWREWNRVPFPIRDHTILIFSTADYPIEGVAGGAAGTRCSVAVFGSETDEVLMLRCWHELLHGLPGIESSDAMLESAEFCTWLAETYPQVHTVLIRDPERFRHDPRPQRLFYTMLTNSFAARTGQPLLPLPPPPVMD